MAYYQQQQQQQRQGRRKSLLIGINYLGSRNQLKGCFRDVDNVAGFLYERGYPNDGRSQVVLRDDRQGMFYPTGVNVLAAMDWLVSEAGTINFLHYSGHGGTVRASDRASGFDDTIVPVDFETNGQIDSDTLHRHLVSRLPPNSTLFVVFDCCHSGSAIELPYVYRTDEDGNINMMDNVKAGMTLLGEASTLLSGGLRFDPRSLGQAKQIYAGARSLFHNLGAAGGGNHQGSGMQADNDYEEDWASENKNVTMFSGCRDDQTSADASISGLSQGAMSWAFIGTMRDYPNADYVTVLQDTRQRLKQSSYAQVPQLSVGYREFNIQQPINL